MKLKLAAAALAVLMSTPALAAGVVRREVHQQQRIGEGIESGALTPREAARLERKEGRLDREIRRDKADGPGLTPHERAKIQRHENRLSRDIYRQKHDAQVR